MNEDRKFPKDEILDCRKIIIECLEMNHITPSIGFSALVSIIENFLDSEGVSEENVEEVSKSIRRAVESVDGYYTKGSL